MVRSPLELRDNALALRRTAGVSRLVAATYQPAYASRSPSGPIALRKVAAGGDRHGSPRKKTGREKKLDRQP